MWLGTSKLSIQKDSDLHSDGTHQADFVALRSIEVSEWFILTVWGVIFGLASRRNQGLSGKVDDVGQAPGSGVRVKVGELGKMMNRSPNMPSLNVKPVARLGLVAASKLFQHRVIVRSIVAGNMSDLKTR